MPLIIGVAGSIATGKSSACQLMVELGATHCDADKLVHRLYDPGKPAFDRIVRIFGDDIVGANGFIDRKVLGAKVFGKPDEMKKLTTAIGNIREAVKDVIDEWHATLAHQDVALIEAVSLVEAGYGQWCHQVWLFASHTEIARKRLMARNDLTAEEADQRLASQRSWESREPASDLVVFNDADYDAFKQQVRAAYDEVCESWKRNALGESKYDGWWTENGTWK